MPAAPASAARPAPFSRRSISLVVIHCADTPDDRTLFTGRVGQPDFRDPAQEIDAWHSQRGFRRDDAAVRRFNPLLPSIGYHYVIARSGVVLTGRHPDEVGAHAQGYNANSLGIVLVGRECYTPTQWSALAALVGKLCDATGIPRRFATPGRLTGVCGHRDLPGVSKTCPGFSAADWIRGGLTPVMGHVAPEIVR